MWTRAKNLTKDFWVVLTRNTVDTSTKKKLAKVDVLKVLRSTLFIASSAGVLYLIENMADNYLSVAGQGVAIAMLNGIVELGFKYMKNNEETVDLNDSSN
jgi:hypothetical protein